MTRFVGGVFGNTIGSDTEQTNVTGRFNLSDHYYMKREGGWSLPLGTSSNPYTSWTELNAASLTSTTKYLSLGGQTCNVTIDGSGWAAFTASGGYYTRFYYGNSRNTCCGSANGSCDNSSIGNYTAGNRREWATETHTGWDDWGWQDADGTTVTDAFFAAMQGQLSTGYKSNSWWLGHNDVETSGCLEWKFADGTTSGPHDMNNNTANHQNVFDHDYTSQLNGWIPNNKIWTSMKTNAGGDPAAMIITWRHSGMYIK
mgnify:CR=1 FL=1|tara:strand:- start:2272 stop:3042 length:771 start_codon:yes stop_codon:yes gene_type:complete